MLKIRIKNHRVNNHFQLSNIRINVLPKEIFALIGKSGSGKSTVAKLAVGLSQDDFCSIQINGIELNDHHERLIPQFFKAGYLPQNLHLKPFHTVLDFLNIIFQKSISPQKEINRYVKIFHLQKILNTQVTHLSGGEKQKLGILNAISEPIEYLVLDEPFSQLDTEQKLEFALIIKEFSEKTSSGLETFLCTGLAFQKLVTIYAIHS
jgi:iron(III) transport system ATP-binding protein